jgi:hypothetical protein
VKLTRAALAAALVVLPGPVAGAQELASRLFLAADRDRDGVLTRAELEATLGTWEALTSDQLPERLERALPLLPQSQTPKPADVQAMVAALPDRAPVKPRRARRVLVLGRPSATCTRRSRWPPGPSRRWGARPGHGRPP